MMRSRSSLVTHCGWCFAIGFFDTHHAAWHWHGQWRWVLTQLRCVMEWLSERFGFGQDSVFSCDVRICLHLHFAIETHLMVYGVQV